MATAPAIVEVKLSSRLLTEALLKMMSATGECHMFIARHIDDTDSGVGADIILADVAVLEKPWPQEWHAAKVVLIDTGLAEEEIMRLILTHKMDGVISTDTDSQLFCKALQTILEGQVWIDHVKLKAYLHNALPLLTTTHLESFSKKEKEIVLLVAEGLKNREIAARLNMSEHTVKTHISLIFKKANVSSRTQLVLLAPKFKPITSILPII